MRILLLSQFYPPVAGGVEVHVAALAEGLAGRGHDVAIATLDGGQDGDSARSPTVAVHRLSSTAGRMGMLFTTDRRHAPPVPDPEITLGLKRLTREFSPEIVHAHNWIGRSFVPLAASSRAKYVETLHDCALVCAQMRRMHRGGEYCEADGASRCMSCAAAFYGPVRGGVTVLGNRAMRSRLLRAVDLFLPVSRAVAEANRLAESGVRYEVVPNFVAECAERKIQPEAREVVAFPDEPFILQVGDAVTDKGIDVLFEAYRRLDSPPPLVVVGRISDAVRRSLPPGAIATGVLPHALVSEAWRRSLFGTMPSLCLDACPTVTLEAMAAGKAVIASERGGLTDQVVHGETGLLVAPGDAAALSAAMAHLITDAGARARMGAAGKKRCRRLFRAEVVVGRIEDLYASLLA